MGAPLHCSFFDTIIQVFILLSCQFEVVSSEDLNALSLNLLTLKEFSNESISCNPHRDNFPCIIATKEPPLRNVISGIITNIINDATTAVDTVSTTEDYESDCSLDNSLITDNRGDPITSPEYLN